jgi:hypothetical protein
MVLLVGAPAARQRRRRRRLSAAHGMVVGHTAAYRLHTASAAKAAKSLRDFVATSAVVSAATAPASRRAAKFSSSKASALSSAQAEHLAASVVRGFTSSSARARMVTTFMLVFRQSVPKARTRDAGMGAFLGRPHFKLGPSLVARLSHTRTTPRRPTALRALGAKLHKRLMKGSGCKDEVATRGCPRGTSAPSRGACSPRGAARGACSRVCTRRARRAGRARRGTVVRRTSARRGGRRRRRRGARSATSTARCSAGHARAAQRWASAAACGCRRSCGRRTVP